MREQERLPEHNQSPIRENEKESIWEGVNELYDNLVYLPNYSLPEGPLNLKRRFWFEEPTEGESWLPWKKFPRDIFSRASAANECTRKIYQFNLKTRNRDTGATTLTPENVRQVFQDKYDHCVLGKQGWDNSPVEFDLHDVYLCIEADLIRLYDERQGVNGTEGSETYIPGNTYMVDMLEPILDIVGQAISEER